ncbi:MAG: preprotein translocase subunit SecE [Bacilli bacterium]|nr:preprotein translocase subunit SecE [Bacilli bacterium]
MKAIARFFVNVKKEMKKVRWPKKKEMIKFSIATIVVICFFMLFFTASDVIISLVRKVFS